MSEQRLIFHPRHSLAFNTDFLYNAVKIDDAGEALEAVCRILSAEAKVHACRATSSQTLDQATYLVGWHDAIHSLRNFILARRGLRMNKNTHIHGVPMCMSFPVTATIPEAANLVASRGTASVFNIPEVPLFGAEKQPDDGFIVVGSSSGTPFNTPTQSTQSTPFASFLQDRPPASNGQDSQLDTSNILAGMDTKTILMNYEREARDSEQRIAAEMAKMSLMRQAIFSDRFFGEVPSFLDQEGLGINTSLVNKQQQDRATDDVKQIFRGWKTGRVPSATQPSHAVPASRKFGLFGEALSNVQITSPLVPQSTASVGSFGASSIGSPFSTPSSPNNTSQAHPQNQPPLFSYASMQSTEPRSQPIPIVPAPLLDWQLDQLLRDRQDTKDLKELWKSYQPGPSFIERYGVFHPPPDATPSAGSSNPVGLSYPPKNFRARSINPCASPNPRLQSRGELVPRGSTYHALAPPKPSIFQNSAQGTLSQASRQQLASPSSSTAQPQDATSRKMEAMYREGDRLLDLDADGATSDSSTRRSQAELAHRYVQNLRARVRARQAMKRAQGYVPESNDLPMTAPSPTSSPTEPAELDAFSTQLDPKAAAHSPGSQPSLFQKAVSAAESSRAPAQSFKYNACGTAAGRGGLFELAPSQAQYNPAQTPGGTTNNATIPKTAAPAPFGGGIFGTSLAPSQQIPSGSFASISPYHSTRADSSHKSIEEEDDL